MNLPGPDSKRPTLLGLWKKKAEELETQTYALYFAYRDRRVPWYAKGFALTIVAYAFSPIDLIPDFIPVLGYLDDFVIIPLGVALAIKMIPGPIMQECQLKARQQLGAARPNYRIMAVVIVALWILVIGLVAAALIRANPGL